MPVVVNDKITVFFRHAVCLNSAIFRFQIYSIAFAM